MSEVSAAAARAKSGGGARLRDEHFHGASSATNPRPVKWVPGPEDIVIDHDLGRAYVSSQIRRGGSKRHLNGGIYELDLTKDELAPRCLTGTLPSEVGVFHPHGIDLYIDRDRPGEQRLLFVINHRTASRHSIDVFLIDPQASLDERLTFMRSVTSDEYLTSPNDLVAVGPDEFFVVNSYGSRSPVFQQFENALALARVGIGTLVHVKLTGDGAHFTRLADGLAVPVGVEVKPLADPQLLFVSAAAAREIRVYERTDSASPQGWRYERSISLEAAPDNLTWDDPEQRTDLLVAAHPNPLVMFLYSIGVCGSSPSRVLRIHDPEAASPPIEVLYEDDGAMHSASSVATIYRSEAARAGEAPALMLVGSPWGEHVLVCDL